MEKAYFFGILFVFFFILFVYQLDLILFFYREKNRFSKRGENGAYHSELLGRQKKIRHPFKKNVCLYFLILLLQEEGKKTEAVALTPFLKNDYLLGITKSSI